MPSLRDAADLEPGYNVIFLPGPTLTSGVVEEVATVGRLTPEQAACLLASPSPVPIARAATAHDAKLLVQRLARSGLRTLILSDTQLAPLQPPRRARALASAGEYLEVLGYDPAAPLRFAWKEISLVVFGTLRFRQVLAREATTRRATKTEREEICTTDEEVSVIDFFGPTLATHVRIRADGFDYSCLGAQRSLLAAENHARLGDWLLNSVGDATVVNRDFRTVARALEPIWGLTKTSSRQPFKRAGIGKVSTEMTEYVDNERQFTCFARSLFFTVRPA
ncbi:MAG: hypothetical protein NZ585_05810 [Chloracidobacterium sp.]|nr:hypothetical protein [Chloracidobacterium sp.]